MKAIRVFFYFLMILCLMLGLYTGMRIFYIIFLCGVFLVISTIALNIFTFYSFRFLQELGQSKCVKGEQPVLKLDLRNETVLPLSMMNIHVDVASPSDKVDLSLNLSPFSGENFNLSLNLPYSGHYNIGMTRIRINDIFGLVTLRFDMRRLSYYRMKELLILPKVDLTESMRIEQFDAKAAGASSHRNEENPEYYSDSRIYRPGDSNRRIMWKKSLQHHTFYVRQYDVPARETVFTIIDNATHGLSGEALLKYADTVREYAATLCFNTILYGKAAQFSFAEFPEDGIICEKHSSFEFFREKLAYLSFSLPSQTAEIIEILRIEAIIFTDVIIITRDPDTEIISALEEEFLSGKNVTLVLIGGDDYSGRMNTIKINEGDDISHLFDDRGGIT